MGVRAIVPEKFKQKLLMNLHDTHLGMVKMKALAEIVFGGHRWTMTSKTWQELVHYATCMLQENHRESSSVIGRDALTLGPVYTWTSLDLSLIVFFFWS